MGITAGMQNIALKINTELKSIAELDLLFRQCFIQFKEVRGNPVVLVLQGNPETPEKQRLISIVQEETSQLFIDYRLLLGKVQKCIIDDDRLRQPNNIRL